MKLELYVFLIALIRMYNNPRETLSIVIIILFVRVLWFLLGVLFTLTSLLLLFLIILFSKINVDAFLVVLRVVIIVRTLVLIELGYDVLNVVVVLCSDDLWLINQLESSLLLLDYFLNDCQSFLQLFNSQNFVQRDALALVMRRGNHFKLYAIITRNTYSYW